MVSPLLPLLLSTAYFGNMDRTTSKLLDQDFGLALRPEQLFLPRHDYNPLSARDRAIFDLFDVYYRPLPDIFRVAGKNGGISKIHLDKDNYKVILDVQQFKPEEIDVKVIENYLVINAKHEEKKDEHGFVSRQFVRRYVIPENVDPDTITSEISSDGVLSISAPVKAIQENKNERKVKIEFTGKPALKTKEETSEKETSDNSSSSTTDSNNIEEVTIEEE